MLDNQGTILGRDTDSYFHYHGHAADYPVGTGVLSLRVKQSEHEAYQSPPSHAMVKIALIFMLHITPPPKYILMGGA
jgi:hypothetical protein